MADTVNSFFSLADLKKSSTLKPLCQMNRNQRGFRGEDFLEINQSEAKIACGGHVCFYGSQLDEQFLYSRINRNFVGSILGRTSIKIAHLVAIRKQTWPPQAILVSAWLISKKCSLLASYQISIHLAKRFQRRFF
jgi:hypothetical protein